MAATRVNFHCRVILKCTYPRKFTCVNSKLGAMYERPRINVNVKVERGLTSTFARDHPYIASHVSLRDARNGKCQVINVIISVFKLPA